MAMEIEHRPDFDRFVLQTEDAVAELRYKKKKDVLHLTHTHVPDAMRGQGVAGRLVKHALEYARENQLKVQPVCSYVVGYFEKHPECKDLQA